MSYLEDNQTDVEVLLEIDRARNSLKYGECKNCGSNNIKTSKKGNLYCGDLCWVKEEQYDDGTNSQEFTNWADSVGDR